MQSRTVNCAVIVCLIATAWCRGAEPAEKADEEAGSYLGIGVLVRTKPYRGADARVYPVPLFAYEGKRLYIRGIAGGYRLVEGEGWSLGPVVQPRLQGYDEDDSSALRGMDDRDLSLDGGAGFSWQTGVGLFDVSFVTDLLGRHDGQELEFSYMLRFKRAGFTFTPSAGVRWKSEELVDYYYGVRPEEAALNRPAYEGNDALDPYLRLVVRRKLGKKWSLLGAVQYEWLDSEITDSPIVDDDYEASFLAGLLYLW